MELGKERKKMKISDKPGKNGKKNRKTRRRGRKRDIQKRQSANHTRDI